MKITCERSLVKRTGKIDFKWVTKFAFSFKDPSDPLINGQFGSQMAEFKKLSGICSVFIDWITLQADYPEEGPICSITLTPAHKDENDTYLLGKVLNDLKVAYREEHPKVICEKKGD